MWINVIIMQIYIVYRHSYPCVYQDEKLHATIVFGKRALLRPVATEIIYSVLTIGGASFSFV